MAAAKKKSSSKSAKGTSASTVASSAPAVAAGATRAVDTPGESIVFFDAGIRSDVGTSIRKDTVGRASVTDDAEDIKSFGPLIHGGFLTSISDHFRVGGAFGYGFNYTLVERLTKEQKQNGNEPDRTQVGQLITADMRLEWNQRLSGPIWLTVTPFGGVTMIAVGDDLKEATEALDGSHNVSKGPRLGFIAGAELGVRYQLSNWLGLKFGGAYGYTLQSLLKATRSGDVADSKRIWRFQASRLTGSVGVEASF